MQTSRIAEDKHPSHLFNPRRKFGSFRSVRFFWVLEHQARDGSVPTLNVSFLTRVFSGLLRFTLFVFEAQPQFVAFLFLSLVVALPSPHLAFDLRLFTCASSAILNHSSFSSSSLLRFSSPSFSLRFSSSSCCFSTLVDSVSQISLPSIIKAKDYLEITRKSNWYGFLKHTFMLTLTTTGCTKIIFPVFILVTFTNRKRNPSTSLLLVLA